MLAYLEIDVIERHKMVLRKGQASHRRSSVRSC